MSTDIWSCNKLNCVLNAVPSYLIMSKQVLLDEKYGTYTNIMTHNVKECTNKTHIITYTSKQIHRKTYIHKRTE